VTFSTLLVHDVTIVTPGTTTNGYGDTVKDWDAATETTAKGWVSQRSASEDLDHRNAEVSTWVLFVDPDVAVTADDRVEWEGLTFEVDGPVLPAHTPRGRHHLEVPLRLVDG
jgi:hypothetical protein